MLSCYYYSPYFSSVDYKSSKKMISCEVRVASPTRL